MQRTIERALIEVSEFEFFPSASEYQIPSHGTLPTPGKGARLMLGHTLGDKPADGSPAGPEAHGALQLLTGVAAVFEDYGGPAQRAIGATTVAKLDGLDFVAGFIRPKIAAASEFAQISGKLTGNGRLKDARAILEGRAETRLRDTTRSIIGEADRSDRDM